MKTCLRVHHNLHHCHNSESDDPAFTYVGVDSAGPLYVKNQGFVAERKVWICLYNCCVVRAVHLDIVPDLTADAFHRCFR